MKDSSVRSDFLVLMDTGITVEFRAFGPKVLLNPAHYHLHPLLQGRWVPPFSPTVDS